MNIKNILLSYAKKCYDSEAAVLLSGGIDSASILFALLESQKNVTCYSFMIDGILSTDFSLAKRNAAYFGAKFTPVILPNDIETLKADIIYLASIGAKKKTDFECGWPMLYCYSLAEERYIFSGMGADGHFCISKKGMLHYRDNIDEFRKKAFSNPSYAQKPIHEYLAKRYNKVAMLPYLSQEMIGEFYGKSWHEINKPKQKQPILDTFPDRFASMKILPHTNLQLGDSGISNHFKKLLDTDWNLDGWSSVVGIYNAVVSGRIK